MSVVVPNFNSWHYLDVCLTSLIDSKFPFFEMIVLDNASIDGSQDNIRAKYPQVRLIENSTNLGHVGAVNQGCGLAKGDTILLLDSDTELSPDSIERMASVLDKHPEVWMVGPKTLNTDGTTQEGARRFPSPINGLFGRQSLLSKIFPNNPFTVRYLARDLSNLTEPYRVESIGAYCMMFRRDTLDKAGFWDDIYHTYFVDSDWCKQIELCGGAIYCVPGAIVKHHDQNRSTRKKDPARIVLFHKSAYRFYRKFYTRGKWDPRSVMAAGLLGLRALVLIGLNELKPSETGQADPFTQERKEKK